MSVVVWIGVGILGGVAAILRFRLDAVVQLRVAGDFPAGTLVVNLTGTFALGVLHGAHVTGDAFLLYGTAVIGSFTTFSTWMLETQRLGEEGNGRFALRNLALSIAGGLAAVAAGWATGVAA